MATASHDSRNQDTHEDTIHFVRHEGLDVPTVGIARIRLFGTTAKDNKRGLFGALMQGVTEWVRHTEQGKDAWASSMEDLNIGDIVEHCGDDYSLLNEHLRPQGLELIDVVVSDVETAYSFDTVLVDQAPSGVPVDQALVWENGCETWPIFYSGGQRGQMTVWPNGRGAVAWGGDSQWGEWNATTQTLTLDDGVVVDAHGTAIVDADGHKIDPNADHDEPLNPAP